MRSAKLSGKLAIGETATLAATLLDFPKTGSSRRSPERAISFGSGVGTGLGAGSGSSGEESVCGGSKVDCGTGTPGGTGVGTGIGAGAGVGVGVGCGVGAGTGVGTGAGVGTGVGIGVGAGTGAGVGTGEGIGGGIGTGLGTGVGVGCGVDLGTGDGSGTGVGIGAGEAGIAEIASSGRFGVVAAGGGGCGAGGSASSGVGEVLSSTSSEAEVCGVSVWGATSIKSIAIASDASSTMKVRGAIAIALNNINKCSTTEPANSTNHSAGCSGFRRNSTKDATSEGGEEGFDISSTFTLPNEFPGES